MDGTSQKGSDADYVAAASTSTTNEQNQQREANPQGQVSDDEEQKDPKEQEEQKGQNKLDVGTRPTNKKHSKLNKQDAGKRSLNFSSISSNSQNCSKYRVDSYDWDDIQLEELDHGGDGEFQELNYSRFAIQESTSPYRPFDEALSMGIHQLGSSSVRLEVVMNQLHNQESRMTSQGSQHMRQSPPPSIKSAPSSMKSNQPKKAFIRSTHFYGLIIITVILIEIYRDCQDAYARSELSTTIKVVPDGGPAFMVACEHEHFGGGWTLIQKRVSDEVNFDRNWTEYKVGFGNIAATHWLGNKQIYRLTRRHFQVLRIVLRTVNHAFNVSYHNFSIGAEEDFYRLRVSKVENGTLYDAMKIHNLMRFSTYDMTHDVGNETRNCSMENGGWWFNSCGHAFLNAPWERMRWHWFQNEYLDLTGTSIMLRLP